MTSKKTTATRVSFFFVPGIVLILIRILNAEKLNDTSQDAMLASGITGLIIAALAGVWVISSKNSFTWEFPQYSL
tara:strand:+ start:1691 stop:1915 length:225 start_codon:yes stop_codon:yes gene_type:complete